MSQNNINANDTDTDNARSTIFHDRQCSPAVHHGAVRGGSRSASASHAGGPFSATSHQDSGKQENGFMELHTRASEYLKQQNIIGIGFGGRKNCRRYVDLRVTDIFNALVTNYTSIFTTYWHVLRHIIDNEVDKVPAGPQYLARTYISAWMHDLYVANRRAARRVCPLAYNEYYNMDLQPIFSNYDAYLTTLQAAIRPTPVLHIPEDTLFVPRFGPTFDRNAPNANYFNIEGWHLDIDLLYCMHSICCARKLMRFEPTVEAGFGRVSWLLDWHHGHAYTWFLVKGNYNMCDVAVAYILGVACTPNLGLCDRDEWQYFPGNIVPPKVNVSDYKRMRPVTYHGAVEVDTIEVERYQIPQELLDLIVVVRNPSKLPHPAPEQRPLKRTRGLGTVSVTAQQDGVMGSNTNNDDEIPFDVGIMSDDEVVPPEQGMIDITKEVRLHADPVNRYRIATYIYFNAVTNHEDQESRLIALRMMIARN